MVSLAAFGSEDVLSFSASTVPEETQDSEHDDEQRQNPDVEKVMEA